MANYRPARQLNSVKIASSLERNVLPMVSALLSATFIVITLYIRHDIPSGQNRQKITAEEIIFSTVSGYVA